MITFSIFYYDHETFHPSFLTIVPVLGTCLIILYANKNEIITKILSLRSLVGIGLISYSLYLWHYPIFVFDRILYFSNDSFLKLFLIFVLIFTLSFLSYRFIEKPSRNQKNNFKIILSSIFFTTSVVLVFLLIIISNNGFKKRFPTIFDNKYDDLSFNLLKNSNGEPCVAIKEGCVFNEKASKNIIIVGDSLLAPIAFEIKDRLNKENYKLNTFFFTWLFFFQIMIS